MHNIRVVAGYAVGIVMVVCASLGVVAQPSSGSGGSVEFGDKGIVFRTADSSSTVQMQFRFQSWATYRSVSTSDLSLSQADALIRRARIKFKGQLVDPRLTYKIEIGFSRSDIAFGAVEYPNAMLDAVGYWSFTKNLKVGMGQTKLPGNRQRVVSSADMEFPDRTIVNSAFNIDRDAGVFAFWTPISGSAVVNLAGAISSGEGRNLPAFKNSGLSYTGRVEFLPLGKFSAKGDYIESDLFREPDPKVSVGFSANWNDRMVRNRGQLGSLLYDQRSATVLYADALAKWNGWSLYGEWAQRTSDNPVTVDKDNSENSLAVFVGSGYMGQLSYTFPFNFAIAGRVAVVDAGDQLSGRSEYTNNHQYAGALTYYFNGHRVKTQLESGAFYSYSSTTDDLLSSYLYARINLEVGI